MLYNIFNFATYAVYLLLIIGGGLTAVLSASLVRALLGLILTLIGVAGMYFLMNCFFIGMMQILIYVGAVSILIFFAIMLTQAPAGAEERASKGYAYVMAAIFGALFPTVLIYVSLLGHLPRTFPEIPPAVTLSSIGKTLLGPYGLAFELISVVLLAVMIGGVLLSFERRKQ